MGPKSTPGRQELERIWRSKLEEAQLCYKAATEEYRKLLEETPDDSPANLNRPLARARQRASEALAEYSRVLQIFSRLTIDGKLPDTQPEPGVIAVIDDDKSVRNSVDTLLRSAGYRVATFESAEAFLESGAVREAGCLILDVRMPGMGGPELQVRLHDDNAQLPIIFITAHDEGPLREQVMQAGAVDLLRKPFAPRALLSTIEAALGRAERS